MLSTGDVSGVEYLQQANDALLTIVQIETKEALENVYIFIFHLTPKRTTLTIDI